MVEVGVEVTARIAWVLKGIVVTRLSQIVLLRWTAMLVKVC